MIWQDIVIAVASWAASFALIPSILSQDKPALWSSVMTFVIVTTFGICYATLGLWWAAASSWILAALWLVLAVQKWRAKHRTQVVESSDGR